MRDSEIKTLFAKTDEQVHVDEIIAMFRVYLTA